MAVRCAECGKEFGTITAHVRVHGLNKVTYKQKYPDADWGFDASEIHKPEYKAERERKINASPVQKMMDSLNADELQMYNERYEVLWKQADMDPALAPSIRDIVMSEIYVLRYQAELSKVTKKIAQAPNGPDVSRAQTYQKLIKETQDQTLKALTALNLTRERKQALKKSPETTPSRLISAYKLTLENMTPLELEKQREDERDVVDRLRRNQEELLKLIPRDAASKDA